jgi:hypothetical protein
MNSSWKTTTFGLLAGAGAAVMLIDGLPHWLSLTAKVCTAVGTAGLGLAARDNDKSSEQVGAGRFDPPQAQPQRIPVSILVLLFCTALLAGGVITGCKMTPARAVYTTETTTQLSVETAMTAWGDYVKAYHPSVDQERQVKRAYDTYKAAMVAAIDASELYAAVASSGTTNSDGTVTSTGARLAAEAARQNAAGRLADLVGLLRSIGLKL